MMASSRSCSGEIPASPMRIWADPLIEPRGLRISWASWAAISPTAASFSLVRTSFSRRLMSVRSWKISRWPPPPVPGQASLSGEMEMPRAAVAPSGRMYDSSTRSISRPAVRARRAAASNRRERNTSESGRPRASAARCLRMPAPNSFR